MTQNPKHHKPKKFLKLPHVSGGKEELRKFIRQNLQYPSEALENKIQGDVIVRFKISQKGEVFNPEVVKGIGYGCDEEAVRLVKMIQYDAVKNRGVRVTAQNKIKIPFRLPQEKPQTKFKMVYTETQTHKSDAVTPKPPESNSETYNYTIKL